MVKVHSLLLTYAKVKLFDKLPFVINNAKFHIYLMFKCHSLLIVQKSNSVEGVFVPANGKVKLFKGHSSLIVQNFNSESTGS